VRVPLAVVTALALAATVTWLGPAGASGVAGTLVAPRTVALGADVKGSTSSAVTSFETTVGRKLAFTRDYLVWDSPFATDYENWLGARGTMPLISVFPKTMSGTAIPWATVAAAQPGDAAYTRMKAWADEVKAFGYPMYFIFNHEPEAASGSALGTPAQFIAAWRRFHDVFVAEGVTNAKWMWTMTAFAFLVPTSDRRYGWNWYPGDAWVDAIGADAYTAFTCDNPKGIWHPLSYQLAGFKTFGGQHPDKPMYLPEWGVVEDPNQPGRKAQWITDAQALFKDPAYAQFVGIAYFNETRPGTACDWHITTSASAKAAYVALAHDDFYSGSVLPDTTAPTVSISAPADGSTQSGTVTVSAAASDDTGVGGVTFAVDGTPIGTDTTAPYAVPLDTTALTDADHALTATATDAAGNTATSAPVTITVANGGNPPDTTPPTVSLTAPADGATVSGTVSVTADASDDVGVTGVSIKVDGAPIPTSPTAPYTASLDTTALANGGHTLTAVASDAAGHVTTSAPVAVTVANAAPTGCPAPPPGSGELSANVSLETNQTGWTGVYNTNSVVTRLQVTGGSIDGGWALRLAPKSGTTGAAGVNNASPFWVPGAPGLATTAGTRYVGLAEVRASVAGLKVTVLVRETTTGGTGVSFASTTVTLNDTAWHAISVAYVARNDGDSIRYSVYGTFTASTQNVLADCLSLQSP
jgi:hypothetical protein